MVYDGYGDNPVPVPDEPDPTPCSYSLSPTGATFKTPGEGGSSVVYAQGSCSLSSLTAGISASWVTVTSTSAGTSSVTIYDKVAVNTGPARTATIDIGGLGFKITQQKAKK